jgi:FkbM family methyltransferase
MLTRDTLGFAKGMVSRESEDLPSGQRYLVGHQYGPFYAFSRLISELGAIYRMAGMRTSISFTYRTFCNVRRVASEGTLRCVDANMAGRHYTVRCLGTTLEIEGSWFGGAREIYGRQTYFAPWTSAIGKGHTVIDLGANVGLFSVLAARLGARVIAVEAQSNLLPILRRNLRQNNCSANVIHGLIGEGSGLAASGALKSGSHYQVEPPILSLNQIAADLRDRYIDFLKIDIEGSEYDLFSKNVEWLGRTSKIAMEVHESFGDPEMIVATLIDAGLDVRLCNARLKRVRSLSGQNGFLYAWR